MTYSDLVTALQAYLTINPPGSTGTPDPSFMAVLPRIIEQAEMRCYRDCDFMATRQYGNLAATAGTSTLSGPAGWLVGRGLVTIDGSGNRVALLRRDETFCDELWPNRGTFTTGFPPKYWAEIAVGTLLIAPSADQSYTLELAYTSHPAPLSATNTTTWLATNCPDLLLYAALVAGSGYVKNFGQGSDNPQMALSWREQYDAAKAAVMVEEGRRKAEAMFDVVSSPPSTTATHGA